MPIKQNNLIAVYACAFIVIVVMQWLHFSWYYKQPIPLAFVWSLVDWGVWFLLFASLWHVRTKNLVAHKLVVAVAFIALAGPVQIILSSGVYQVLYETDKTVIESFIHLMNKRWFQNVLIASSVVLIYQLIEYKLLGSSPEQSDEEGVQAELNVFDGKIHHKIKPCDVYAACSTKNYVSLYTKDDEVVIRTTLKEVRERLGDGGFVQVSRSALVNTKVMSQLCKYSNSSYHVILANDLSIKVSRTYVNEVKACFS